MSPFEPTTTLHCSITHPVLMEHRDMLRQSVLLNSRVALAVRRAILSEIPGAEVLLVWELSTKKRPTTSQDISQKK